MSLLNKLTIKNLKLNKKRTIVTIIGIILSVSLVTAVAALYTSLIPSLINFEIREKGNFHVVFYDVPVSDLETFKNNREIEGLYLTQNVGYSNLKDAKSDDEKASYESRNEEKPYAYVKAFTKGSLENLSVKLVEGRLPENKNEIVIPTHLKTNGRVEMKVGENITLKVGRRIATDINYELDQDNPYQNKQAEKIVDTKEITYKIVGIIERPATNIESYSAPGYTFITCEDENDMKGKVDVYAKYTKYGTKHNEKITAGILGVSEETIKKMKSSSISEEEVEKIRKELEKEKYNIDQNDYLIMLETNPIKDSGIGGLGIVVGIVCGIIVFSSVFCIKNSFDISITEKIKQYGMLRSVGATKKQIKKNVFYEATILGIIGIPLGILAGLFAAWVLIIVSNYFLTGALMEETNVKLKFAFSWLAIGLAVVLGIVTIYLSALRSARKASKISPIDSIRNSADIKIKAKKLKKSKIINKLFGIGGDISYKNLKRNKKKYRTTVMSISVSVLVFIALSAFMKTAFYEVDKELNMSDYNLKLYFYGSEKNKELYQKVKETTKLSGILDCTICRHGAESFMLKQPKYNEEHMQEISKQYATPEDENEIPIGIVAINDEQYKKYIRDLGLKYEDIKDKCIFFDEMKISIWDEEKDKRIEHKIRRFTYSKGDIIKGNLKKGEEDINLEIGCITDKLPFGFNEEVYSSLLVVSDEFFDNHSINCRNYEVLFDAEDASKLQDEIDEVLKGYDTYNVYNIEEQATMTKNLYILIGIFLYGFIIVISLIGITNIFNTITTNMELRKQEFAMLKSIGMTENEFKRMIRLESLFMGVKALVFGIPIGIILSLVIFHFLEIEDSWIQMLPIGAVIISIVVVFLLISIIMRYSISKINKQNTIETIRNENI